MNEFYRIAASVATAVLLCIGTRASVGAMQQSGYKNATFFRWLRRKDNLFFNRLASLSLCLALASAVTSLCFSFLGGRGGSFCAAAPFFGLCVFFALATKKYALKVPLKNTGRANRLFAAYLVLAAAIGYGFLAFLGWLNEKNGSQTYALIAYLPFAVFPTFLPVILALANGITGVFENARNKKFVKRAGQVLDETKITRIGVVGSFGKTSVKNILKTLLSERYSTVETPASYNTPIGIAKTVFSSAFSGKEILIAEMGARKTGDIAELCRMVKPDYAVFTGVCAQHVGSFGSVENIWAEKSEILRCGAKKVVCGEGLRAYIDDETRNVAFPEPVKDLSLKATTTAFTLSVGGVNIDVKTPLLGECAAENIALCVKLCEELGMTAAEIERGLAKLQPVPHRLQLLENGGAYILDDGYNGNPRGAKMAIEALSRFDGGKCVVTPGIVECGVLEEKINGDLGAELAKAAFDKVILVGETQVGAVKDGYLNAGGDAERLTVVKNLEGAKVALSEWTRQGDAILFLNDLPDVY